MSNTKEIDWRTIGKNRWAEFGNGQSNINRAQEINELKTWIIEQTTRLPEIETREVPLALAISADDFPAFKEKVLRENKGNEWVGIIQKGQDGQDVISEIRRVDGESFSIKGRLTQKKDSDGKLIFEWKQPFVVPSEYDFEVPTREGKKTLPVHGFIGLIRDTEGRILITLNQETGQEDHDKNINAILALSTSVDKLKLAIEGPPGAEPKLRSMLDILSDGDIKNLLDDPDKILLQTGSIDTNRGKKNHNLIILPDPIEANSMNHEALTLNGANIWCTPHQVDALIVMGLTNEHTPLIIRQFEALTR